MALNGNGRRKRYAHDRDHNRIRVRRARCRRCNRSVTVLPDVCIPRAIYSLLARREAIQRIDDGMSLEQAAPDCRDPDRIADPSTLRRWQRRRRESLALAMNRLAGEFVISRVATLFAWDWKAAGRILIPEPNPT